MAIDKNLSSNSQDYTKFLLENMDIRLSKIEKTLSRLRLSDIVGATEKRKTRPEMVILKSDIPFEGFNWYPTDGKIVWTGPAALSTLQISIDRADPKICEINYVVPNKKVEISNLFIDGVSVKFQNDTEAGVVRFIMDQDSSITGETELGILVNTTISAKVNAESNQVFWVGIGVKNMIIAPSAR
jgi:hypothetical protein